MHGADYEKEGKALRELRAYVEERLALRTRSSAGNNEYFYAYLTERNNEILDGVFVMVRHDEFSWSREGKWALSDIQGAAHAIESVVRNGGLH